MAAARLSNDVRMRALITLGLLATLAVIGLAVRRLRHPPRLDAGTVSESWLAEQRAESYDPGR